MNTEPGSSAAGPTDRAGPTAGNSQIKTLSPPTPSRHSPVTPLAPLEFLQNNRRGSITDPSLHAAAPSTFGQNLKPLPRSLRQPEQVSAQPLPASGYRFGEPSRVSDTTLPHFRQLLRSPSTEGDSPVDRKPKRRPSTSGGPGESGGDYIKDSMEIETQPHPSHGSPQNRSTTEHIDLNARRPSIAGTKRKLSPERDVPMSNNGDTDSHLASPGLANTDTDAHPPKRRGSTFDARIGQLTLDERRNSIDARTGPPSQWWSERRDSTTSMFSANTPLTGYSTPSSGLPGDSPHGGRPPAGIATFAWPVNPHQDQTQGPQPVQTEGGVPTGPHYDLPPMMPPVPYPSDRRMSVPVISTDNMSAPASGPARVRQRSRPTSRARVKDPSAANATQPGSPGSNVNTEDAIPTPTDSRSQKEPGATPYSRSPELRVSHKLAERKRRKEMKELFDELRDTLPADRGMKASKWEILSKAIDFIGNLKQSHQEMAREIEMLRHELEAARQGLPPFAPGGPHPVVYPHGPPVVAPYPPPPGPQPGPPLPHPPHGPPHGPPPPHTSQPHPAHHVPQPPPSSPRPGSSHDPYPPSAASTSTPPQNQNSSTKPEINTTS